MSNMGQATKLSEVLALADLVDIGRTGRAEQSSLSQWSRPDDAQNAVWGVDRDFAFHTDSEDAPWWSLTFEKPQKLHYLVLENRRNVRFRHLADHLTIKAETADQTVILHDAVLRFGTGEDDSALVVPMVDVPPLEKITITAQTGGGYLHLSQVRMLAQEIDVDQLPVSERQEPLYFIANRNDGFGERLRAVLNAMVAAEIFGGHMLFDWPHMAKEFFSFNDVLPIGDTFAQSFLEGRHANPSRIKSFNSVTTPSNPKHEIQIPRDVDAVIVDQRPISHQFTELDTSKIAHLYKKASETVKFVPSLEAARSLAMVLDLGGEFVALHLRAGDIVYGKFRAAGGFTGKAIPYPIIAELIKRKTKAGSRVILFGQDLPLCSHLAETYGAHLAADFATDYGLNKYESAIFEICLMSRCTDIYSGGSGFATLASWTGSAKIRDVNKDFSNRKIVDIILSGTQETTDRISDLQKSYAYFYILQRYAGAMTKEEQRMTIDNCLTLDPENPLYQIISAGYYYVQNDADSAEAQLMRFSRRATEWDLIWSLSYTAHTNMIRHHLTAFEAPAEAGHPMAALCLAIRAQALSNTEHAAHFAALYRANKGDLDTPLEAQLTV